MSIGRCATMCVDVCAGQVGWQGRWLVFVGLVYPRQRQRTIPAGVALYWSGHRWKKNDGLSTFRHRGHEVHALFGVILGQAWRVDCPKAVMERVWRLTLLSTRGTSFSPTQIFGDCTWNLWRLLPIVDHKVSRHSHSMAAFERSPPRACPSVTPE